MTNQNRAWGSGDWKWIVRSWNAATQRSASLVFPCYPLTFLSGLLEKKTHKFIQRIYGLSSVFKPSCPPVSKKYMNANYEKLSKKDNKETISNKIMIFWMLNDKMLLPAPYVKRAFRYLNPDRINIFCHSQYCKHCLWCLCCILCSAKKWMKHQEGLTFCECRV